MKGLLESLIRTMNKIEVHGKDNMDMLLGCIQTLEKMRDACNTKVEEITVGGDPDETDHQQGD